jgi:DNA-3-methyladenine glycosylase II
MMGIDGKLVENAHKFLSEVDPVMRGLIKNSIPFKLKPVSKQPPFEALIRAVASQQLHGVAAAAILGRFIKLIPEKSFPEPDDVERFTDEQIRSAGISRGKIQAIRDLTFKVKLATVPSMDEIRTLSDDEIIARITQIRGVGLWTVEMLQIFNLGRLDVLPVDDFGVRRGFTRAYGIVELAKPKVIRAHGEKWRPYRTIASWYLWRAAYE